MPLKLNTLDYRTTADNVLSFELLVGGRPLAALAGVDGWVLPAWLIGHDLPTPPPSDPDYAANLRVVAVTACCGLLSCGHLRCQVLVGADIVVLTDFARAALNGVYDTTAQAVMFRFARANYAAVIRAISLDALDYERAKYWLPRAP